MKKAEQCETTKSHSKGCDLCGNKRRSLAWSNKHHRACPVDGWRMGGPMLVCGKCEYE